VASSPDPDSALLKASHDVSAVTPARALATATAPNGKVAVMPKILIGNATQAVREMARTFPVAEAYRLATEPIVETLARPRSDICMIETHATHFLPSMSRTTGSAAKMRNALAGTATKKMTSATFSSAPCNRSRSPWMRTSAGQTADMIGTIP
jgi:hypothetical protein